MLVEVLATLGAVEWFISKEDALLLAKILATLGAVEWFITEVFALMIIEVLTTLRKVEASNFLPHLGQLNGLNVTYSDWYILFDVSSDC